MWVGVSQTSYSLNCCWSVNVCGGRVGGGRQKSFFFFSLLLVCVCGGGGGEGDLKERPHCVEG